MTEHNNPLPPPGILCNEIVPLLSEFLDGRSSLDDRQVVEVHLMKCPPCTALYVGMRDTQAFLIRQTGEMSEIFDSPDSLWDAISSRILSTPVLPQPDYDASFISAYLDGENSDAERELFECHLAHHPETAETLGDFLEISRLLHGYGLRLEENCSANMMQTVIDCFAGETTSFQSGDKDVCEEISLDDLSVFMDGELPASNHIEIQQHLEQCGICREHLLVFRRFGEAIATVTPFPELKIWPHIQEKLLKEAAPLRLGKRLHIAFPPAVAALFFAAMLSTSMFLSYHSPVYPSQDDIVFTVIPPFSAPQFPGSNSHTYAFFRTLAKNAPLTGTFFKNAIPETMTMIPQSLEDKETAFQDNKEIALSSGNETIPATYIPSAEEYLNRIHQEDDSQQPDNLLR